MATCVPTWELSTKDSLMSLFTPDLYRNFAIGFGAGAIAILLTNGGGFLSSVPQLVAAIV